MKKLLFVYNADSGLLNFVLDAAHKLFSPSTYPCNLCALTYSFSGLPRWRRFVKTLPWPVEFIHRDELAEQYNSVDFPLPTALLWDGHSLQAWIAAEEMNAIQTLDALMAVVEHRAKEVAA
jgi:hypothetical protein